MRYAHTNIITEDWKSLSDFYITVFECKIIPPIRNQSGDWLSNGTGVENAALEGVHLLLPGFNEDGPTLEIYQYQNIKNQSLVTANQRGFGHLAFEVDDVNLTLEKMIKHGGSNCGEVTSRTIEKVGVITFVYARDPDGNLIELQSWIKEGLGDAEAERPIDLARSANAEMMIRKPIDKVYEAFVNPEITSKFWFSSGTGRLETGKKLKWVWDKYNLSIPVKVLAANAFERIEVEWGDGNHKSKVLWEFTNLEDEKTFVKIVNYDFLGSERDIMNKIQDSIGGFNLVLAGAKAWLEHGIQLQLVEDKSPG